MQIFRQNVKEKSINPLNCRNISIFLRYVKQMVIKAPALAGSHRAAGWQTRVQVQGRQSYVPVALYHAGNNDSFHFYNRSLFFNRSTRCAVYWVGSHCIYVIIEINARQDNLHDRRRQPHSLPSDHDQDNPDRYDIQGAPRQILGGTWQKLFSGLHKTAHPLRKEPVCICLACRRGALRIRTAKNQPLHRIFQRKGCKSVTLRLARTIMNNERTKVNHPFISHEPQHKGHGSVMRCDDACGRVYQNTKGRNVRPVRPGNNIIN